MPTSDAYALWQQANGDGAEYRRLMREAGRVIALKPGEKAEPLPCGWPGAREGADEEKAAVAAAMAPLNRLMAIYRRAREMQAARPDWREGQAAFNALVELEPECAEIVRGMDVDPFYRDHQVGAFWEFVGDWIGEES